MCPCARFDLRCTEPPVRRNSHKAAIALGSNLGDRFTNIEHALRFLEHSPALQGAGGYASIIDTSFLYETEPMYVTDQPKFVNCACLVRLFLTLPITELMNIQIETNLSPVALLKCCKEIENAVGRVVSFRNGPRAIDLDILLYDNEVIDTRPADERANLDNLAGHLVVPHPRIAEREFVLRPLYE